MSSVKELNIILLGETGTGKSLLVNSVANYFQFKNLNEAVESEEIVSLISSKFEVTDSNYETHELSSGENDGNERTEVGESFTVNCKSYKFQLSEASVRLIDTPGVGDTKGDQADRTNIDNILSFVNNFDNLNAIAIVMKNTETKMTERFSDCLKMLLTNLNKSAVDNIVFILTFSKANDFKPGPVKKVIERFIKEELEGSALKLNKDRMYCLDNSSYECLMATHQGVVFDDRDLANQNNNWQYSSQEMDRLLQYISRLSPHAVKDTSSLFEARQFIKVINPFLPEILQNIDNNRELIKQYQNEFNAEDENIINTVNDRNLKQIYLQIVQLDRAVTFCTSDKCREKYLIGSEVKYHYPKKCCVGCVTFDLWKSWCTAMGKNDMCNHCGCHRNEHERRFYETMKVESNLLSEEAIARIKNAIDVKEQLSIKIEAVEEREGQLLSEKSVIEDAEKKFAKFLQIHALAKPPESKSRGTFSEEFNVINEYEWEIAEMNSVSKEDVYNLKEILINLPINGQKIKEILEFNAKGLNSFIEAKETIRKILRKLKI